MPVNISLFLDAFCDKLIERCKTTQYYDSALQQCLNRKTFRESCTVSSQCEDYFGLICYANSTCLCPSTKYWARKIQFLKIFSILIFKILKRIQLN